MRRLILFRHAKAEPRAAGEEDIDRPLSQRGGEDAARVGRRLAADGVTPDLALVSSSLRTRQTWDCVRGAFPAARAEVVEGLYNATCEEIAAVLEAVSPAAQTVMVIGHNPGLQELSVSLLVDGGASPRDIERVAARFPTATAAAFRIDAAGRAALDGLFGPRDHAQEGPLVGASGEAP